MNTVTPRVGTTIAAIDLGSNSFHLAIARVLENRIQVLHRIKQRVRLAEGMDDQGNLGEAAMVRGWECLAQFNQRLQETDISLVRVVGTYALRRAPNRLAFIDAARAHLDHPIDVVPGREEARLIYAGVSHTQDVPCPTLVMDIGGGSTEFIIGQGQEARMLESLHMGCVSYHDRYFADGKLSRKRFKKAQLAAEQQLEPLLERYRNQGWEDAIGCSGTIKALAQICKEEFDQDCITLKSLEKIKEMLCDTGNIDETGLDYLSETRRPVLPAGLAVLLASFHALGIEQMRFSDAALREGVIHEMAGTRPQTSVCQRTVEAMRRLHHVDQPHAREVADTAVALYQACDDADPELSQLLEWAASLHEVGLSLNFKGMHRHGGYILEHSNMPGFTLEQKLLMSFLVRWHRKRLQECEAPRLALAKPNALYRQLLALRLASLWHLGRRHNVPRPALQWGKQKLVLTLPDELLQDELLLADLFQERQQLKNIDWQLELVDSKEKALAEPEALES